MQKGSTPPPAGYYHAALQPPFLAGGPYPPAQQHPYVAYRGGEPYQGEGLAPGAYPPPPQYQLQDTGAGATAPAYNAFPPPMTEQAFLGEGRNDADKDDLPPEYQAPLPGSEGFSEKSIRRAFIKKVYITLAVQLVITVGIICMFIYWKTLKRWVQDNSWFSYALFPAIFILIIVLACCDNARRKVPGNFILLGLFTIFEGLMLGAVSALFDADAVMWAVGATAFVTLGMSLFAFQTKWDFTMAYGILWVVVLVVFAFGILCAIIRSFWLQIVYASIGTLVFAIYLVVDTQLMLGGKHRYSLSPEEYIFAALNLYLDIANVFLFILQIVGLSR
ncbi:protein lifeguard 1-like [Ambystoma mexicanum]|uniref:protein lifeguard 1-like n=1 Tax=Ambystoma mexicanum TaxID=8296 RepID=UPI0037E86118